MIGTLIVSEYYINGTGTFDESSMELGRYNKDTLMECDLEVIGT